MKTKQLIIEIDGETVKIEGQKLGEGLFAIAYRAVDFTFEGINNPVIIMPKVEDYSKEVMKHVSGEAFFPVCEFLGYDSNERAVYVMEFYEKLTKTAATVKAWEQAKTLQKLRDKMSCGGFDAAYEMNNQIIESLPVGELQDALFSLQSWASAYGEDYAFEFNRANLAINKNGDLILRDPVFSVNKMREIRRGKSNPAT